MNRHARPYLMPGYRNARSWRHSSSLRLRTLAFIVFLVLTLIAALAFWRSRSALAAPQEQPVAGPGLARTGSAGPKTAASSSKAGSMLFFHKFTSDARRPSEANTLLTITNTNPRDAVAVHLLFLANCSATDQFFSLGPNQTRTILTSKENVGSGGYAVAMAVNSAGVPTQFNWLIGSASVRDNSGREVSYNAFAVAKRTGGPVSINGDGDGELNFNGSEYDRLPKTIALDNIPNQNIEGSSALATSVELYSPSATPDAGDYSAVKITATALDQNGKSYAEVIDNICGLSASLGDVWFETPINEIVTAGRPGWATFKATALESGESLPMLGLSVTEKVGGAAWRNARQMQVLEWLDTFKMKVAVTPVNDPPADALTQDQPEATGDSEGASETKAGSLLVFPRFVTTDGGNTLLNLTNTDPSQKIRVRLFFSNLATTSQISDRIISLAPSQTTTLDLSGIVAEQRGWALAVAIDSGGRPVQFNRLIGSAQVLESTASGAASAAYNALAIAKNSAGPVDRNADALSADLLFDDENYDRLPATAAFAAVPSQDDNNTLLGFARPPATLLNGVNFRGSIFANLYDDAFNTAAATIGKTENVLSTVRSNGANPHFASIIGKGHRGWLKLLSATPLFAWANTMATAPLAVAGNSWSGGISGGGNLHYLTASDFFKIVAPASNPNNHLPVAAAETIGAIIEARRGTGTIVRLDGSASSDEDLDPLTYQWTDNDRLVSDSRVTDLRLGLGLHNISLTVTDSSGAASIPFEQLVDVRDTTAPQISGVPSSIIRNTASPGGATVSYRLPVAYDMVDGWVPVSASRAAGANFPLGTTIVTFTARDRSGNVATATMNVVVILDSREAQDGGTPGSIAPVVENINDQYIPPGTTRDILLRATDQDNDPVTFSLLGAGPNAQLVDVNSSARQATLRITAAANNPVYEIRVIATDSRRATFRALPFRVFVNDIANDETGSGKKLTNRPPTARLEPLPAAIQATNRDGAVLQFDGSKSTDPDGDNLTFVWMDNGQQIAQGVTATPSLAVGQHSIVLIVSDGNGGVSSSSPVSVEVLPRSLSITSATPKRLQTGTIVTMTINGSGIVPGTRVSFSKSGVSVISYQKVEEDRIIATVQVAAIAEYGFGDIYLITPTGKSARLRSGVFISQ